MVKRPCLQFITVSVFFALLIFKFPKAWALFDVVSINSQGVWGNHDVSDLFSPTVASVGGDGRFVVFESAADNLVPNDKNGQGDVFLRDRILGTTERISVASDGTQGNFRSFASYQRGISEDGRYVVFSSRASNLLGPNVDTNGDIDVFLHDRQTHQIILVSHKVGLKNTPPILGSSEPSISADGKWVVFSSTSDELVNGDNNFLSDVFLFNVQTGEISIVSVSSTGEQGQGKSDRPSVNNDGTKVAFRSDAANLVVGDRNGASDIFVRDITNRKTFRASVPDFGVEFDDTSDFPSISDDCRVAFSSRAANNRLGPKDRTIKIFVRDWCQSTTMWVSGNFQGMQGGESFFPASLSGDGQCVVFEAVGPNLTESGHVNPILGNIYLRNLQTNQIQLINKNTDNGELSGFFSSHIGKDCSIITFGSNNANLVFDLSSPRVSQYYVYSPIELIPSFLTFTENFLKIGFDSSASRVSTGAIIAYQWDFGDGTFSTEPNPSHTYTNSGIYYVRLMVVDNIGNRATARTTLDLPPGSLGGGGFGCSYRNVSVSSLPCIWISILILGSLLFVINRFRFRQLS